VFIVKAGADDEAVPGDGRFFSNWKFFSTKECILLNTFCFALSTTNWINVAFTDGAKYLVIDNDSLGTFTYMKQLPIVSVSLPIICSLSAVILLLNLPHLKALS